MQTIITTGSLQSNQCRKTAAAAKKWRLRCIFLLHGEKTPERSGGNLFLNQILGAEIRISDETLAEAAAELKQASRKPYTIPIGGSNAVGAMAEMTDQLKRPFVRSDDATSRIPSSVPSRDKTFPNLSTRKPKRSKEGRRH